MRPAHFLYSCQSGWYKNSQTAVSAPVRKQLRIIKSLREAKVESFSNLMFSVWWTTPEGRGGGGGGGLYTGYIIAYRLPFCFSLFSPFFSVFPCFPMFSPFFLCFSLFSYVFPCFLLFPNDSPCFLMFCYVFLCFPMFSPFFSDSPCFHRFFHN